MTLHILTSTAAAVGLAGLAVLGTAGTASAAPAPESCAYGMTCEPTVSDSTVVRGQSVTVSTGAGAFRPGSTVTVTVFGQTRTLTAAADGSASHTFVVPDGQRPGRRSAVFTGGGATVRVAFTIVPGVAATPIGTGTGNDNGGGGGGTGNGNGTGTGTGNANGNGGTGISTSASGLPRTGSGSGATALPRTGSDDVVALSVAGLSLIGAGAAFVVVARRRKESATA